VRPTRKDTPVNLREERGLALADAAKISRNGKGWIVPSQTGETPYTVILNGESPHSLRSKSDVGQINEALCMVCCHNISVLCHAMHRLATEPNLCA
jgi:hypothetical protein